MPIVSSQVCNYSAKFWQRMWPTWTGPAKWCKSTGQNVIHRSAHEKVLRWSHNCDGKLACPSAYRLCALSFSCFFFWWVEAPERKPSLNQISSPFFLVWLRPLLCCQKDIWRPWWTMWPNCQTIGNTSWRITQDIWFVCGTHTWTEVLVALFTVPSQGAQQVYFCFFHFLFTNVRAEEPPKNHLWNAFPTPLRRWNRCVGRQLHVPAVVIWFFTIFDEFSG